VPVLVGDEQVLIKAGSSHRIAKVELRPPPA
jgi:hypothetical protein